MINVMVAKIQKMNNVIGMKKIILVKFGLNVLNKNRQHIVNLVELVFGMENVSKLNVNY